VPEPLNYLSPRRPPDGPSAPAERGCLGPGLLLVFLAAVAVLILCLVLRHLTWGPWFRHLTGSPG
jgi:hypothetical protein